MIYCSNCGSAEQRRKNY